MAKMKPTSLEYPVRRKAAPLEPQMPENLLDEQGRQVNFDVIPGAGFNLVDGTVAFATAPNMPYVLFKSTAPDTWLYAPRFGRLANRGDGTPDFSIVRKVHNNPDGSKTTTGGVLSFLFELVMDLPDAATLSNWHDLIGQLYQITPASGRFNFQPMRLTQGSMSVFGLNNAVTPGQVLTNIPIGASSSIACAFELNGTWADTFYQEVGSPIGKPQVGIVCNFKYQYVLPTCSVHIYGNQLATYNYFSTHSVARASYFGLWGGSVDIQTVRTDLHNAGGLQIDIVGTPPAGFDIQKLLDAVFDRFVKQKLLDWVQPDPNPVAAADASGFFGGASFAMKDVQISALDTFEAQLNFSSIADEVHNVSFNFESAAAGLDPAAHRLTIEDDRQLAYRATISSCNFVQRFVPIGSYTTLDGTTDIDIGVMDSNGGVGSGIIQFASSKRSNLCPT